MNCAIKVLFFKKTKVLICKYILGKSRISVSIAVPFLLILQACSGICKNIWYTSLSSVYFCRKGYATKSRLRDHIIFEVKESWYSCTIRERILYDFGVASAYAHSQRWKVLSAIFVTLLEKNQKSLMFIT